MQVVVTNYGAGHAGPAIFWFVVGCLLLLIVYRRRSRVAHGAIVVSALIGAVIYTIAALEDASATVLAVAYLGQAVPLLMSTIREHVRTRP